MINSLIFVSLKSTDTIERTQTQQTIQNILENYYKRSVQNVEREHSLQKYFK